MVDRDAQSPHLAATTHLVAVAESSSAVQLVGVGERPPPPLLQIHHVPSSASSVVVADAGNSSSSGSSACGYVPYGDVQVRDATNWHFF